MRWGWAPALAGFVALSGLAGVLAAAAVTPAVALTGSAADSTISVFDGLPEYIKVEPLAQASTMYALSNGQQVPIASFYSQNRVEVGWDGISQNLKDAAIATEDPRFYEHGGVDVTGTVRGAVLTALHKSVQGGSSITQQYVKNILVQRCENKQPDPTATDAVQKKQLTVYEACYDDATKVDPSRKLKEMRYAIGLEKEYSKNDILQSYLNIALFGGRVYGVQSAAEYYFGVAAKDVNIQQAATLIAILNNPDNLRIDRPDDKENGAANGYKETLDRRNYVLDRMFANGKITKEEHDAARATKVEPKITPTQNGCMTAQQYNAAFFCDYVERTIEQNPIFGKTEDDRSNFLTRGGLKIYTTLNLDLQSQAQAAVSAYIPPADPRLDLGSSNVSVEVGTGRVVTMVQNRPYDNTANPAPATTAVNYNTDYDYGGSEGFQTGSAYKVFDLLEWLQEGHSLYQTVSGTQHVFPQTQFHASDPCNDIGGAPWNVSNDEGESVTATTVMNATAQSINTVFAKMATQLDLCGIKQRAQDLLVHGADEAANPFMANPSAVLGTNYIAPITMATAYAGLANNGVACSPIAIDKIVDADGAEHAVPKTACSPTPIDPQVAAAAIYALQGVLRGGGTASSANPGDGIPIFGKTGTTDNSVENWLVTSTTKVAQATWVGNVQGGVALRSQSFQGIGGGNVKFSIVKRIQTALNAAYGGGAFPSPSGKFTTAPVAPKPPTAPGAPTAPAPGAGGNPGNGGGQGGPGKPGKP
ncbi:Membrane carboxypeptidase (penicillin-binding protein) [Leifsonia sp. 98AMF]|uniref:transglycosylase domain-containing protein n=1 Tax=unclassified Leifsonia TaxID=2663824 RepID=UPI0008794C3E|nr:MULTISPECIES: transglycosylase domain-containing protein [unclassified Leifsonia]SDH05674.1 Membrane carboxypeptidase (penicillin-binding protein) [Leifsonia sp. 197AMF]SDJ34860.1 Membrane carboxypeptidase (penicillin-binding protein) [Leifsonia sp. 466MF]SDK44972.1 Membrane carboxypeptidase (penicillin-binding protein) [Leifsonia sp. 157MF]SDN55592.1 Membrane carboxypeptidase (penicillin-binding protein) [Leifsonia sp. 509MF]SEN54274.1 Membrane carboxypeptidase (penicillin-binding protein)